MDSRRVKDVHATRSLTLAEFWGEQALLDLGYRGDAREYRARLLIHRRLAAEGRGPIAEMRRDLARMGYRPRQRWPKLTFAWNEAPTPEWLAALAADAKGELR